MCEYSECRCVSTLSIPCVSTQKRGARGHRCAAVAVPPSVIRAASHFRDCNSHFARIRRRRPRRSSGKRSTKSRWTTSPRRSCSSGGRLRRPRLSLNSSATRRASKQARTYTVEQRSEEMNELTALYAQTSERASNPVNNPATSQRTCRQGNCMPCHAAGICVHDVHSRFFRTTRKLAAFNRAQTLEHKTCCYSWNTQRRPDNSTQHVFLSLGAAPGGRPGGQPWGFAHDRCLLLSRFSQGTLVVACVGGHQRAANIFLPRPAQLG